MNYGPVRGLIQPVPITNEVIAFGINNYGSAHRIFGAFIFATRFAVLRLLDGFRRGIESKDLLVGFVCLRAAVEHVAHFNSVIVRLRDQKVTEDVDEAHRLLGQIHDLLEKSTYGTRVDWFQVVKSDPETALKKDAIKYRGQPYRVDTEAGSILKAIDLLEKNIKGTRAVYELLCEFAHPNVGLLWLMTESSQSRRDKNGVFWVDKSLGSHVPGELVKNEMVSIPRRILRQADLCLQHFLVLQTEAIGQQQQILRLTQVIVRRLLGRGHNSELFDTYSLCPCGSGAKLKFCCVK